MLNKYNTYTLHTYFHFKSIGNPAAHLKYCKDAMEQTQFKLRTYFWLMLFIYTIKLRKIHVISNIYNYITTHNLSIKYAHRATETQKKNSEKIASVLHCIVCSVRFSTEICCVCVCIAYVYKYIFNCNRVD